MALPRYTAPKLTPRQQAALDLGLFSFLVRFRHKDKVRVSEAAGELRMSENFIRALIQEGQLEAIGAQAKGKDPRKTYIITTRSLLRWMLKNSNLDADGWNEAARDFVETLDGPSLTFFAACIEARQARLARLH